MVRLLAVIEGLTGTFPFQVKRQIWHVLVLDFYLATGKPKITKSILCGCGTFVKRKNMSYHSLICVSFKY